MRAMHERNFMFHLDYPTRLRELVGGCRKAAAHSYELEAKAAFRMIGEHLSNMADEIERNGNRKCTETSRQRL
jgi:hypothetical protein